MQCTAASTLFIAVCSAPEATELRVPARPAAGSGSAAAPGDTADLGDLRIGRRGGRRWGAGVCGAADPDRDETASAGSAGSDGSAQAPSRAAGGRVGSAAHPGRLSCGFWEDHIAAAWREAEAARKPVAWLTLDEGEVALILDDFHRHSDGAARESVAWFIGHVPSTFQLVLSTRVEPAIRWLRYGLTVTGRASSRRSAVYARRGG